MHRIAVLIGTRPEAIKMAPVVAALERSDLFEPLVVNTGQHRELIEQVISLFGIRVDRDLAVMEPNQALAPLMARLLERIDAALADLRPDMVLAQGDTSTVFATSLVSFYRQIPFGHVEAGLRTVQVSFGDRTVERIQRRRRDAIERVVQFGDPSPIGVSESRRAAVLPRDASFHMIARQLVARG